MRTTTKEKLESVEVIHLLMLLAQDTVRLQRFLADDPKFTKYSEGIKENNVLAGKLEALQPTLQGTYDHYVKYRS
jgi:hypothetical protein